MDAPVSHTMMFTLSPDRKWVEKAPFDDGPRKVDQTHFSDKDGRGGCLQAALATLFDCPLSDVPDLRPIEGEHSQSKKLHAWLEEKKWGVVRLLHEKPLRGFYIASGPVKRSIYIQHAVVMRDGVLYHDPHPSREGLCFIKSVLLFYPLRPSF